MTPLTVDDGSDDNLPKFMTFPRDTAPVRVLAPELIKLPEVRSPVEVKAVKLGEPVVDTS